MCAGVYGSQNTREILNKPNNAGTRDRTKDLQIFSLTLSQLSYHGHVAAGSCGNEDQQEPEAQWSRTSRAPPRTDVRGDLAQMVERSLSMREALGSMPRFSIFGLHAIVLVDAHHAPLGSLCPQALIAQLVRAYG